MSHPYQAPADARLAASLLLLRDGDAQPDGGHRLQVLMLRRAEREGDMRSGAAVFPGGVVDADDRLLHAHSQGPDDTAVSAQLGLASGGLDYALAAVRETFEEVGLLLADVVPDEPTLKVWRTRLLAEQASFTQFCAEHGLRLDVGGLAYHSHWLTPPGHPKRFDTRFFMALAPADQTAVADYGEALELMWLTPRAALAPALGLKLLPVTQRTLQDLARFADAQTALLEARSRRDIRLQMPRLATSAKGRRVVLPDELPYAEVGRLDPDGRGDVSCELRAGVLVRLSERIARVTAPNPGPMTGPGTNSYLVVETATDGLTRELTVIDPGPESAPHTQALLTAAAALDGRIVRILVTHTHRDHSPGALALAQATGAPVWGRTALHPEWQDASFVAQRELVHGERLVLGAQTCLRVVHTPGHASNHLCYLLEEEKTLFTGDHVMQGSTVVINPPDGDMAAYLAALRDLLDEDLQWLAPGHGFLVAEPHAVLRALIAHRLKREAKVLAALQRVGPASVEQLVADVYADVSVMLHGVAQRSLSAHLIKLQADGLARVQPAVGTAGVWSCSLPLPGGGLGRG